MEDMSAKHGIQCAANVACPDSVNISKIKQPEIKILTDSRFYLLKQTNQLSIYLILHKI